MRRDEITAYMLLLFILLTAVVCFVFYPMGYLWLTYEDSVAEWSQVCFLLVAAGFLLKTISRQKEYRLWFALLLGLSLYVAGEEISWGQRLFSYDVPQIFQRYNLQQETNLHNFIIGPYNTQMKRFSEYLIAAILVSGAFYSHPVSDKLRPIVFLKQRVIPSPPHFLWPFFCFAGLFELRLLEVNEAELAELLICFAVAVYAMYSYFSFRRVAPAVFSQRMLAMFLLCSCLAVIITVSLYQSEQQQAGMVARLMSGQKAFAIRYQKLGMLGQSRQLLLQLQQQEPSAQTLRALAENSRLQGDEKVFFDLNQQAIDHDVQGYSAQSDDVLLNLSLFESFAQRQARERAAFYLRRATQVAAQRSRDAPENAHAVYLLGRVFQIVGKREQALRQFERASDLDPTEQIYRQAFYRESQRKHGNGK